MLPSQFLGQNLHFAICLLAAFVFFGVFWLYFDAWVSKKPKPNKEILVWIGFLLAFISFLAQATIVDPLYGSRTISGNILTLLAVILRLIGYVAIILGLILDPLQKKPKTKSLEEEYNQATTKSGYLKNTPVLAGGSSAFSLIYALPVAALAIAGLYWRRASTGLERHLKPVAMAFILFFGFELVSLSNLWSDTNNPNLYNLVKTFGPLWIISYVLLFCGAILLGRWVWQYLTERFQSQLFMIFTTMILVIFLLTTVSFTYLLMRNVEDDNLNNLATAANVLNYALESKKAEAKADANSFAQNPQVVSAIAAKDHKMLANLAANYLNDNKQSSLIITSGSAQVLLRAEQPDHWGDSISSDPLVRKALIGQSSSSIVSTQGVLAPVLFIRSAVAVRSGETIIGTVSSAAAADSAFVDGIKHSTGLDSALYSGNTLSATTLTTSDGQTRQIGIKQNNSTIKDEVLTKNQTFKGSVKILNRPFLAVYTPLKDGNNNVVGMLFIGQPQAEELQTINRSVNLTFIVSVVLLMISIAPAYIVARYLSKQLD